MQRYFASVINNKVTLDGGDVHHLLNVMRMKKGDKIEVIYNKKLYICEIFNANPLDIEVIEECPLDSELGHNVTLFFALAKGDKIDFVIQKATEIGVSRIVLFKNKRCVVNFDNKDINKKMERYNKIAKEASEQCHRSLIPEIVGVVDLKDIEKYKEDYNLVAYEKEAGQIEDSFVIPEEATGVSIAIGSEGGFDEEDIEYLNAIGFKSVSLGKRILRCETAAIYALSVIAYNLEK